MGESYFQREKKERNYTTMDNTFLRDKSLSLKATGIFSYILSLPDDWKLYMSELVNHFPDGKTAIRSAINELIKHGYIERYQKKNETGKFLSVVYIIIEQPKTIENKEEKPQSGFLQAGNVEAENLPLLSTNRLNTNIQSTNIAKRLKDKCSDSTEDRENKYRISRLIKEFDRRYMKRFGEHHSHIYDNRIYEQLNSIVLSNSYYSENEDKEFQASFDIMLLAMDKYFNTKYSDCDYKIWHFLSDGILTNLLRKVAA
jgi:hypothetical protein